jgi:hypothetical protein
MKNQRKFRKIPNGKNKKVSPEFKKKFGLRILSSISFERSSAIKALIF